MTVGLRHAFVVDDQVQILLIGMPGDLGKMLAQCTDEAGKWCGTRNVGTGEVEGEGRRERRGRLPGRM